METKQEQGGYPLQETVGNIQELVFLEGISDKIIRVDEIHRSKDHDTAFHFVIWAKQEHEKEVFEHITKYSRKHRPSRCFMTADGMIFFYDDIA